MTGAWSHAVGVWTTNGGKLYVNGVVVGGYSTTLRPDYSRGFIPSIAGNSGSGFDNYGGIIDDIRIYNRAFSDSEVQQLYTYERPPSPYLTIAIKTIRLNMFVALGKTNQLESSSNLISWTPYGSPFLATNAVQPFLSS